MRGTKTFATEFEVDQLAWLLTSSEYDLLAYLRAYLNLRTNLVLDVLHIGEQGSRPMESEVKPSVNEY